MKIFDSLLAQKNRLAELKQHHFPFSNIQTFFLVPGVCCLFVGLAIFVAPEHLTEILSVIFALLGVFFVYVSWMVVRMSHQAKDFLKKAQGRVVLQSVEVDEGEEFELETHDIGSGKKVIYH